MKNLFEYDKNEILEMCVRDKITVEGRIVDEEKYSDIKSNIRHLISALSIQETEKFWALIKEYYLFHVKKLIAFNQLSKDVELGENKIFLKNTSIYEQENTIYKKITERFKKIEDLSKFPFLQLFQNEFSDYIENCELEIYYNVDGNDYIPEISIFNSEKKAILILNRNLLKLGKDNVNDFFTIIRHELGHVNQKDIHPTRIFFWHHVVKKKLSWAVLIFSFFLFGTIFILNEIYRAYKTGDLWEFCRPNNWLGMKAFIVFMLSATRFIFYKNQKIKKAYRFESEFLSDLFAILADKNLNVLSVLENEFPQYINKIGSDSHPDKSTRIDNIKETVTKIYLICVSKMRFE